MNIFICEDHDKQRQQIKSYILNYLMIQDYNGELICATGDPQEIIKELIARPSKVGLYFIDVDLQSTINGIQLAAEIRKIDTSGSIVFITTHAEMAYLTFMYKVEALDFIIKDDFTSLKERIVSCIDVAFERHNSNCQKNRQYFQTKIGSRIMNIPHDEILFFESSTMLHKVILHTMTSQIEFYGKLKDIEILSEDFYRCHNSYVVNKKNISNINLKSRTISFITGASCLASIRQIKQLLK